MGYRFAINNENHADLASGAVLRSAPGFPAFPVRLSDEIFARAWQARGARTPATVWDPCCGSGYFLSVIALRHRDKLRGVVACDADSAALTLAAENLQLLSITGLIDRAVVLRERAQQFDKNSYLDAAEAAQRLAAQLRAAGGDLPARCEVADAFCFREVSKVVGRPRPDILVTDVPYGEQTSWWNGRGDTASLARAAARHMHPDGVIALTTRGRKVALDGLPTLARFKVGTRAVALLSVSDAAPRPLE